MKKRFFISSLAIIFLLMSALALTMPAFAQLSNVQIDSHNIDASHMPYPCETETPNEWHFVITQIDEPNNEPPYQNVPSLITVQWGTTYGPVDIPLEKFTGKTAHYRLAAVPPVPTTPIEVTEAYTYIYPAWEEGNGNFNLSHAPCSDAPVATYSYNTTCYVDENTPTVTFTLDHVSSVSIDDDTYTVTPGNLSLVLLAGDYTITDAVPEAGYQIVNPPPADFSIVDCPEKPATYSIVPSCYEPGKDNVCFAVNNVTLTITGPGGEFDVSEDVCMELMDGPYNFSAVADPGFTLVGPPDGSFTILPCPGPCYATYSIDPVCWVEGVINSSFFVNHVTLTLAGPEGPDSEDYVMTTNTQLELIPGYYNFTAVPDAGCELIGLEKGGFDIVPCPKGGKSRVSPPPIYEISGLGYGGSDSIIGALVVTLLATLLALAFKMRYRLFDLFSRQK